MALGEGELSFDTNGNPYNKCMAGVVIPTFMLLIFLDFHEHYATEFLGFSRREGLGI